MGKHGNPLHLLVLPVAILSLAACGNPQSAFRVVSHDDGHLEFVHDGNASPEVPRTMRETLVLRDGQGIIIDASGLNTGSMHVKIEQPIDDDEPAVPNAIRTFPLRVVYGHTFGWEESQGADPIKLEDMEPGEYVVTVTQQMANGTVDVSPYDVG